MSPKKGGLKDKINAALERGNAGRQAKLSAKADVSAAQGNLKKSAKLEMKSKKVALRSEKRQAISDAKKNMKNGTTPKLMMKSTLGPVSEGTKGNIVKPNPSTLNININKLKPINNNPSGKERAIEMYNKIYKK